MRPLLPPAPCELNMSSLSWTHLTTPTTFHLLHSLSLSLPHICLVLPLGIAVVNSSTFGSHRCSHLHGHQSSLRPPPNRLVQSNVQTPSSDPPPRQCQCVSACPFPVQSASAVSSQVRPHSGAICCPPIWPSE